MNTYLHPTESAMCDGGGAPSQLALPMTYSLSHGHGNSSKNGSLPMPEYNDARELEILERQVRVSFISGSRALRQIWERKLYRLTHSSFDSYCSEKFGFCRSLAYLRLNASVLYDALEPHFEAECLPVSERQVRPMVKHRITPEEALYVWRQALLDTERGLPSGTTVAATIRKYKYTEHLWNPGDYVRISKQALSRRHRGFWGQVVGIEEGIHVLTARGLVMVRSDDLEATQGCPEMQDLLHRLSALPELIDSSSGALVNTWGRRPTELNSLEMQMLVLIEDAYRPAEVTP